MPSLHKSENLALFVLLLSFCIVALGYSVTIPLGEAPDEVSHFAYTQYLVQNRQLPPLAGAAGGEANQPPLYYLLGAAATFWIPELNLEILANPDWQLNDPDTPNVLLHTRQEAFPYQSGALAWHLIRLVSVVLGAVTVWATFYLAQETFPDDPALAFAAAAFVAFLPEFTFLSSVVNNDNLVNALSALTLLLFIRVLQIPRLGHFVLLGILLGLDLLAKISAFTFWVTVAITLLVAKSYASFIKRMGIISLIFVVAFIVICPWMIYNTSVFNDPLSWSRFMSITPRVEPMTWSDWLANGAAIYDSFWGKFGGATHLRLPFMTYLAFAGLLGIGFLGALFLANDWRKGKLSALTRRAWIVYLLFWFVLAASHIQLTTSVAGMDQARRIFPGLPILAILLVAGILRFSQRYRNFTAIIFAGGMASIGLATWIFVCAWYAPPSQSLNALPSLNQPMLSADFGGQIRVIAARVEHTNAAPGDSIPVQIYWQAQNNPTENYWLLLQLAGKDGIVANEDGVPSAGRVTTDWWQKDQVFASRHTLVIPKDAPPGTYTLWLGLHPFGRWEWLPVHGQDRLMLAEIQVK